MEVFSQHARELLAPSLTAGETLSCAALVKRSRSTLMTLLPLYGIPAVLMGVLMAALGAQRVKSLAGTVAVVVAMLVGIGAGVLWMKVRQHFYLVGLAPTRLVIAKLAYRGGLDITNTWSYPLASLTPDRFRAKLLMTASGGAVRFDTARITIADSTRPLQIDFSNKLTPGGLDIYRTMRDATAAGAAAA